MWPANTVRPVATTSDSALAEVIPTILSNAEPTTSNTVLLTTVGVEVIRALPATTLIELCSIMEIETSAPSTTMVEAALAVIALELDNIPEPVIIPDPALLLVAITAIAPDPTISEVVLISLVASTATRPDPIIFSTP